VPSFDPKAAMPSPELLKVLTRLAAQPATTVYILSGRPHEALDLWFGSTRLSLVAEHGAWVKHGSAWYRRPIVFNEHKQKLRPLLEYYAERTPGATIEEKTFSLVWHYRKTPPELAYERALNLRNELTTLLQGTEIGVYTGNKIIEVKPKHVNKGAAVEKILKTSPADFILCAGDDYTDEDMFAVLPSSAFTLKVGPGEASARYRVNSVDEVLDLLKNLGNSRQ
jgi:trehalose 6-phosphate synthase/phosphatase